MPTGVYKHYLHQGFQKGDENITKRPDIKKKISKANKGKKKPPFTEEHRKNISKNSIHYWLGRKNPEHSKRMKELCKQGGKIGFQKGHIVSVEIRKKMRKSHLGQDKSPKAYKFPKGHKINLGRKRTLETRKRQSKSQKGEKGSNYRGGLLLKTIR